MSANGDSGEMNGMEVNAMKRMDANANNTTILSPEILQAVSTGLLTQQHNYTHLK